VPSLAMLPAALGVGAIYWCVRGRSTPVPRARSVVNAVAAG